MKVILRKDVAKVGQQGSIVEVADGFALNSLIPRGLAEQATPDKVAAHAAQMKKQEEAKRHEAEALATTVKSLENARIELRARATEKGGLFKSIAAADVAKAILAQRRALVPESAIMLEKHLKEVGEHSITIRASGAEARITVAIAPEDR